MVIANVSVHRADATGIKPNIGAVVPAEIRRDRTTTSGLDSKSSISVGVYDESLNEWYGVQQTAVDAIISTGTSTIFVPSTTDGISSTKTARRAYPDFAIAGQGYSKHGNIIKDSSERKRKYDEIEVTWISNISYVEKFLRPLNKYAGKIETIEKEDGGFEKIDISPAEANKYTLIPPDDVSPPMNRRDVLIQGYKEKLTPSSQAYEVTVRFAPLTDDPLTGNEVNQSYVQKDEEWRFSFSDSTIVTNHVTLDSKGKIRNSISTFTLTMILDDVQTETLQNNGSKIGAVNVWNVDEGVNYVDDGNENDRSTVYLEPPNANFLKAGYYAISNWKYEAIGHSHFSVEIELITFPDSGIVTTSSVNTLEGSVYTESLLSESEITSSDITPLIGNSQFLNSEIMNVEAETTYVTAFIKRPDLIIRLI